MRPPPPTDDHDVLGRHRPELLAHCRRILGSASDAEDAVQETLLRAWRAWDRLEAPGARRAWMFRIATNACLDMLRARRPRPSGLEPLAATAAGAGPDGAPALRRVRRPALAGDDPAELVAGREHERAAVAALLGPLPDRQRGAVVLCELLHLSAAEAAGLLGVSVAAVASARQRARGRLRDAHAGDEAACPAAAPEVPVAA